MRVLLGIALICTIPVTVSVFIQDTYQLICTKRKLCSRSNKNFLRLHVGILLIIGVFTPIHNSDLGRVSCFPNCLICTVICRHFRGKHIRDSISCASGDIIPSNKGISCFDRIRNLYFSPITSVNRLHTISAIQVKSHFIIQTIVINLDDCASVRSNGNRFI